MKVLLLDPHLDDIALNCTGYILKHPENEYHIMGFSECETDGLLEEWIKFNKQLKLIDYFSDIERRFFFKHRQHILDYLIMFRDNIKPDIVFCPHHCDKHQDHNVITAETLRAFHSTTIYFYSNPKYIYPINSYLELTGKDVNKIAELLSTYQTQQHRHYMNPLNIRARYRDNGTKKQYDFAECYYKYQEII